LGEEPGAGGFDIVEGRTGARHEIADDGAEAEQQAAPVIEVGGEGEKTGFREPASLAAVILPHA
jgi:hypothetical protein